MFFVQSGLLSPQKNGIMRITNIFKEAGCVGSIYDNPAQEFINSIEGN